MSNAKQLRKQRQHLWNKFDGRCENCGVFTVLPEDVPGYEKINGVLEINKPPDNMATIQHRYSKVDPMRHIYRRDERRHFLWCNKCNNDHARYVEQPLVDIKLKHENKL